MIEKGRGNMRNFMYIYSTVHRKNFKLYILSLLFTPIFIVIGSIYLYGIYTFVAEKNLLLYYMLAIFGFPFIFTAFFIRVNHEVAKNYKLENPKVKRPYWQLLLVGHGLSYILTFSFVLVVASLITVLGG